MIGFSVGALIILLLTLLIIFSNVLILLVLLKTDMLTLVNRYFFFSLTLADLCVGLFVAPFSFWTSLFDKWIYGEKFCLVEAYLAAIFWIASVYSLMWLSIDHYVAIRKPDRYESIMTRTRSVCWVILIWIASVSFCCPSIFGISLARYNSEAYLCIIDWSFQKAYFVTSGILIIVPPFLAMSVANLYVFTSKYRQKKVFYEQSTEINSRPDLYVMNVVIGGVFILSWLPMCALQIYETLKSTEVKGDILHSSSNVAPPALHFWLTWLAVGNSFWKFPVYVICFHDFRTGIKMLYSNVSCRSSCCC